jgi:hypothetical protein
MMWCKTLPCSTTKGTGSQDTWPSKEFNSWSWFAKQWVPALLLSPLPNSTNPSYPCRFVVVLLSWGLSPTQFQHIKHQTSPWPRDLGRFLWMFHDFWILLLDMNMSWLSLGLSDPSQSGAAQLFPAPVWPKTKLSGRKSWPKGPARTLSMVPGAHWEPMGCW